MRRDRSDVAYSHVHRKACIIFDCSAQNTLFLTLSGKVYYMSDEVFEESIEMLIKSISFEVNINQLIGEFFQLFWRKSVSRKRKSVRPELQLYTLCPTATTVLTLAVRLQTDIDKIDICYQRFTFRHSMELGSLLLRTNCIYVSHAQSIQPIVFPSQFSSKPTSEPESCLKQTEISSIYEYCAAHKSIHWDSDIPFFQWLDVSPMMKLVRFTRVSRVSPSLIYGANF